MMKKIFFAIMVVLLLNMSIAFVHEHNFDETKQLIDSGISCDKLTDEQLEFIGDYYMEQMHSGEIHVIMDEMMGGEGSDNLKQMHIQMAKRFYCDGGFNGMMSGDMMGGTGLNGSSWWMMSILGMLFWIALFVVLILLIIFLYKKIIGQATNSGCELEILKKRFVKGEITKKEFEIMKNEIR